MPNRLLLVDGHAYAYRAFHAIRSLNAPDGSPTNAIFGFIKMLLKMEASLIPSHRIVIWDAGLAADRMEALPSYKRVVVISKHLDRRAAARNRLQNQRD